MNVNFEYNHPEFVNKRKALRRDQTDAESIFWQKIRNKQLKGYKFFRQYSVGPYIIDFYSPKLRLAIELDGSHHLKNKEYDQERTIFLESKNIRVLRFWNNDVIDDLDSVLKSIWEKLP